MLRTIVTVVIFILLAGVAAFIYLGGPSQKNEETYVVSVGMVKKSVKGLGRVEGIAEANLSFGRPGRLDAVEKTEGQEVGVNDTIALMNSAETDAQIAQANADVKSALAKL